MNSPNISAYEDQSFTGHAHIQYNEEDVQHELQSSDSSSFHHQSTRSSNNTTKCSEQKMEFKTKVLFFASCSGDSLRPYKKISSLTKDLLANLQRFEPGAKFRTCINSAAICLYSHMNLEAKFWMSKAGESKPDDYDFPQKDSGYYMTSYYNMLGDLCTRNNNIESALAYINQAIRIYKRDPSPCLQSLGWCKHNMGEAYLAKGIHASSDEERKKHLQTAEKWLSHALEDRFQKQRPRLFAFSYETLMRLHMAREDYVKAEEYYTLACDALDKFKNDNLDEWEASEFFLSGRCKCNYAKIMYAKGNNAAAEENYQEGIDILRASLPEGNALLKLYEQEESSLSSIAMDDKNFDQESGSILYALVKEKPIPHTSDQDSIIKFFGSELNHNQTGDT